MSTVHEHHAPGKSPFPPRSFVSHHPLLAALSVATPRLQLPDLFRMAEDDGLLISSQRIRDLLMGLAS